MSHQAMRIAQASAAWLAALVVVLTASAASARPEAPRAFCAAYPEAPNCKGRLVTCAQCHSAVPAFNPYGTALISALYADGAVDDFEAGVTAAVTRIESDDSDGDGLSNLEEIMLGTSAGNPLSHYALKPQPAGENPGYAVGKWDAAFAYKRVMISYCGKSPTYEELKTIRAAADPRAEVHDALDACLASDYWRDEGLARLADNRIRPLKAIGLKGVIPLADYDWDYRLFAYVLTGDRDARELLTADYHVDADFNRVEGTIAKDTTSPMDYGPQPLIPEQRAGMITTQWFFVINTMFSALPRTTAAQAYRAYLGADIAKSEGIMPVANEPTDVDGKGVQAPDCAACHSTLDPLSYAFSAYDGIRDVLLDDRPQSRNGQYNPTRTPWGTDSVLLGKAVPNLRAWAEEAVKTDAFARNLGAMFFTHGVGEDPGPAHQAEFEALWRSLDGDGFSANRLIHRVIDTDAFGVP